MPESSNLPSRLFPTHKPTSYLVDLEAEEKGSEFSNPALSPGMMHRIERRRQRHKVAAMAVSDNNLSIPRAQHQQSHGFISLPNLYAASSRRADCNNSANMFRKILVQDVVDIKELRKLSWKGIPHKYRGTCWKYMFGLVPVYKSKLASTMERKRREYFTIARSLGIYPEKTPMFDLRLYHQINIDVPRMYSRCKIFRIGYIQEVIERVLYCWAIRHPATGYVQGLNDILSPIIVVFLFQILVDKYSEDVAPTDEGFNRMLSSDGRYDEERKTLMIDTFEIEKELLLCLESDSFWCFSRLLGSVQDRYTVGQPRIIKEIQQLKVLMEKIDRQFMAHLRTEGIFLTDFVFRWFNCLLVRELPLVAVVRLWDTYLSEEDGFTQFNLFISLAFLSFWATHLAGYKFQNIILFFQRLPTEHWTSENIVLLTSEAFLLKEMFNENLDTI